MTTQEVIEKLCEVFNLQCEDPGEELIRCGRTLVQIGEILRGRPVDESRRIITAVAALHGLHVRL